jgi:hypothetical protein
MSSQSRDLTPVNNNFSYNCLNQIDTELQGGSDKSGILKIFLENLTAQLEINRFIKLKRN